jgi:phage replication O-like protein O
MANPQIENGYTKIANEVLDTLVQIKINADALKLVLFIIRKTYGFNKKQDKISLSQFVLATQLKKSVVCRGLNRLTDMNIIIRIANDDCTIYRFNKDFDTWKPLAKLLTLAKQLTTVSQTANKALAKQRHTKESIKETNTKEYMKTHKDFLNEYRIRAGKEPMAKITPTEKQLDFIVRSKLIDIFKSEINPIHGKSYFTDPEDIADIEKENAKINGQIKIFWIRCKKDLNFATEVIKDFATDKNSYCNWKPSVCFRKETVIDFENKSENRGEVHI